MNAEDLSLVVVIVGSRGATKTLLMTHFVREALNRAWMIKFLRKVSGKETLYPDKKVNVWASYPVKSLFVPPGLNRPIKLEPIPLDLERLVIWSPEFRDGIVFFDEIDQIADRQDWASTVAKLLTAGAQMFRHRNLTLFCTIQSFNWLNARMQWQADIIIKCRDLAFTPWGRTQGLARGEVSSTTWIDKSGVMTGYAFEETGQVYPLLFFGKRYWGSYPTRHEVDIIEYKRKFKLDLKSKVIKDRDEMEEEDRQRQYVMMAVDYFKFEHPGKKVKSTDFSDKLREFGCTLSPPIWGHLLRQLGVKTSLYQGYNRYDFSGIEPDKVEA